MEATHLPVFPVLKTKGKLSPDMEWGGGEGGCQYMTAKEGVKARRQTGGSTWKAPFHEKPPSLAGILDWGGSTCALVGLWPLPPRNSVVLLIVLVPCPRGRVLRDGAECGRGRMGKRADVQEKWGKKSSNMHIWGCIGEKKEAKAYVRMYTQQRLQHCAAAHCATTATSFFLLIFTRDLLSSDERMHDTQKILDIHTRNIFVMMGGLYIVWLFLYLWFLKLRAIFMLTFRFVNFFYAQQQQTKKKRKRPLFFFVFFLIGFVPKTNW